MHCKKKYVNQKSYDKHVILCKVENTINDMNIHELRVVVGYLFKKCNQLESNMNKINASMNTKKRNVIKNKIKDEPVPENTWINIIKQWVLTNTHLQEVFKKDFEEGFMYIVDTCISSEILFKVYDTSRKEIYIYTDHWIKMQNEHVKKMIQIIQSKLSMLLRTWSDTAKQKEMEKYDEYSSKVYGFNYDESKLIHSLHTKLYVYLKKNITIY